jgi:hypothetical protein
MLNVRKQGGIAELATEKPVLDHFGKASAELAGWQGGEDAGIREDENRLVKRADDVLLEGRVFAVNDFEVHRRFAADAGIDHR